MKFSPAPALTLLAALLLPGCGSTGPGTNYDPPTTDFATKLGIETPPPVTPEEAMGIAAEAAGGTATGVEQESEGGELLPRCRFRPPAGTRRSRCSPPTAGLPRSSQRTD